MATWRFCSLLNKKQAVAILLWYVTCILVNFSVFLLPSTYRWDRKFNIAGLVISFGFVIIIYSVLGLFADAFIGQYRLIQFSLWIQWITVIISTFITAMSDYFQIHELLQSVIILTLHVVETLGLSSFQIVAIQFGTDQLQGAPSQLLSAFIFWYFMVEMILAMLTQWILYLLSFPENKSAISERIPLAWNLLSAIFVSVILCVKSCFMSQWFLKEGTTSNHGIKSLNLYRLIYSVLKFAKEHKSPIQRSALTYWEGEIPSRIDLGKRKYGGPFTNEEVENVKTFLQLLKLLLSLSGILVTLSSVQAYTQFRVRYISVPIVLDRIVILITALCHTATVCLLILFRALFSCCCKYVYHFSMLKRIGIGAISTITCALYILVINFIKNTTSIGERHINVISYLSIIIPIVLFDISHILLIVSLFEFIIAQSPHTMKGVLIGFFYIIRFGVVGFLALIKHYAFNKLPCTSALNCSDTVRYIVITIIALLSFIMYCILANKYKLRERDEVVNVHIFAEEYYGNHKEDSNEDYSDVDD